ncbi:MAG: hypothetical protein U0835_16480 [Isosphaeraceae bacterium]
MTEDLKRRNGWAGRSLWWWSRPAGRAGLAALGVFVCVAPAWLFADPLTYYSVYGDDWEFVASSRTFGRALENLWTPHNVHVVPAWRLWTALVVSAAGRLERLQPWMAGASYAVHAALMLLAGRFVARETRRTGLGVATAVLVGTSSLMFPAATWFSASQASAAAFGVLLTLWYAQGWRRSRAWWRLPMMAVSTWIAGGSWTAGHVAGMVAAVYLLADRRPRCKLAAVAPLLGTAVGVAVAWKMGSAGIAGESATSFHGRKVDEAVAPLQGFYHTIQATFERLILGGFGLQAETSFGQAVVVWLGLAAAWLWTRRANPRPSPLECAGLSLVVLSYGMLWSFRGYLPFSSLRGFMPWYETIPYVGACLFLAGWWAGARGEIPRGTVVPLSRIGAAGLIAAQVGLIVMQRPRCETLFRDPFRVPVMIEAERRFFPIPTLQHLRSAYFWEQEALRQRRHLARLDAAQDLARRAGFGRDDLNRIYGRHLWPDPPRLDDANLLDLPYRGEVTDPATIVRVLGRAFDLEPKTLPPWLEPGAKFP